MKHLIVKELKMATPLLTYLFLGFTLMTFIPGYPILCGAFFVEKRGVFHKDVLPFFFRGEHCASVPCRG